ncbi:MAG: hypothetical protein KBA21_02680 [Mesotoga sp.]|nr:hypothetical protein [Mesotoga sp.]
MKVSTDKRIRLVSTAMMLTELPELELRKPHAHHFLYEDTMRHLAGRKQPELLNSLLKDGTAYYFLFTYAVNLSWPYLEPLSFPDYLYRYEPALCASKLHLELRELLASADLESLWEGQKTGWEKLERDASTALEDNRIEELLRDFFGDHGRNLFFFPNPLFPELASLGAASDNCLYCIARYPGRSSQKWPHEPGVTLPGEEFGSFGDQPVWSRIVAFHEFCHPLIDPLITAKPELVEALRTSPFSRGVLSAFMDRYPSWEDMLAEFLIYAMTYAYLFHEFDRETAEIFHRTMEERSGFSGVRPMGEPLLRYLEERKNGEYVNLFDYLPVMFNL